MDQDWITTKEAARRLNISVRRVVDRIHKGKLNARRDGKIWLVHSSLSPPSEDANGVRTASERTLADGAVIGRLRDENEYLKQRIEELEQARERSDTIILQLTRQLEQSQRLLEYHQAPFWRRWFKREKRA